MKKYLATLLMFIAAGILAQGQAADPLVSSCISNAGPDTKYLKDFRVQLGKTTNTGELRYKAQMSLWKNTKPYFHLMTRKPARYTHMLILRATKAAYTRSALISLTANRDQESESSQWSNDNLKNI
jgi:hypothetical protein